jgi:4-amino-4-deoxy-L-arabinose transferase-like glycosyltransferase
MHLTRSSWLSLLAFVALAIGMRWGSFFISVINHDESTYIVIANELLRGEVYLRDVIDTKPIGIFWLYAALIKLTGGGIVALRLAAAVAVGLGGWLLSRMAGKMSGTAAGGFVAGVTYVLACSVYKFYGVSPNTEIWFNLCTIGAVALTVVAERKQWALAGLLLGTGFLIKPFVTAEALAIGLYLIWHYRRRVGRMLGSGLLLVTAFLLPVGAGVAYFTYHDLLAELWYYGVEVSRGYPVEAAWYERVLFILEYFGRYFPLVLLGGVAQVRAKWEGRRGEWLGYLLLQFVLVAIVVSLTGKQFGHYQIQLHPVLALWVGTTVGVAFAKVAGGRAAVLGVGIVALALGFVHHFYYAAKPDEPRRIAAYLVPRLGPGETFFTINGHQIAFYLLDRPVPVALVHPSLLFDPVHQVNFRVDPEREAAAILTDGDVTYLIARRDDPALESELVRLLLPYFGEAAPVGEELIAYRRR